MRILLVISSLRKSSGVSTFVAGVANACAAAGHAVTVAVRNPAATGCAALDARVALRGVDEVLATVKPGQYDVAHLNGLWEPLLHRACRVLDAARIPLVWSVHGMLAPWSLKHKRWKKFLAWHLYQKRDLQRVRLFHATVPEEEKWIRDLGFTQPVVVAPLGTTLPPLPQSPDPTFPQSHIRTLLFVGRIYPVKALDRLIEAFARCGDAAKGWRLRLVGPDQAGHMAELMSLCDRLGLPYTRPDQNAAEIKGSEQSVSNPPIPQSHNPPIPQSHNPTIPQSYNPTIPQSHNDMPHVEFVGPRFDADLSREYASCDCLALVSHTENFGATVVDALAHGKPVITSTKTPWKVVQEKGCGWWVENDVESLARALREMMGMPDDERRMVGDRGRPLVEESYSWSAVGRKLVQAYQTMVSLV